MTKEINYPIKYAVLELKERGGWAVGYEDITQGFIVSKCYVVGSNVVYHSDGTNTISYEVIFPFSDISSFKNSIRNGKKNIGDENIPHYDACNRPYPVNVVSDLFDSYEQAKEAAVEKNECFKYLIKEYEESLEVCNIFEQLVLEATENMCISEELSMDSQKPAVKILKSIKRQI